jgi:hypothetical protein
MRWVPVVLLLAGCEVWVGDVPDAQPPELPAVFDAGAADAGVSEAADAGEPTDAGPVDAGAGAVDAGGFEDAGVDAGVAVDAGVDAGVPAFDAGTRTVEVLVAQGRFGRTTISCDDGRSWILDRDESNGAMCGEPPLVDCWHDQWSSMGLAVSGDAVLATWGWGAVPGRVRRTTDGVSWVDVTTATRFGAITAGAGTVVGASNPTMVSRADGAPGSWMTGGGLMSGSVSRLATFVPGGGGRFVIALDAELKASDDLGASWFTLPVPSACLRSMLGLLANGSTLVLVHWQGTVCTSSDRGMTWTERTVGSGFSSRGVVAQGAFFLWDGVTRYRSTDGLSWTTATGAPGDVSIGAVAVTSAGTFVAFKGGWLSEYQNERAYRSADGLTWTTVPSARSHPITHLVAATVRASAACP